MFNLLPDNLKEELKAEYKKRWLILLLVLVIFLQVSFLIFFLPSWALSLSKEREISSSVYGIAQSASSKDAVPIASIISDTNKRSSIINTLMEYPEVVPLINTVIENKISSIHINEILYRFADKANTTVTLSGVSDTRDSLVSFVKKLESSGSFKSINLPVSNFTKDKDISFSLSMIVLQQAKK